MSLWQNYKTSSELENNGIDLLLGKNSKNEDIIFKVRRISKHNKKYALELKRLIKPHEDEIRRDRLDVSISDEISRKVFINHILVSWSGVEDRDGKELVFSKENAEMLFKELPDLFEKIQAEANDMNNFQDDILESDLKNS